MMDEPIDETMPWARMKCQYLVDMDVIIRPNTCRKVPTQSSTRGPYASRSFPTGAPKKSIQNTIKLVIHETVLGE